MSLSRQVSKYLHPILREHGFRKEPAYWRRQDEMFYFVVSLHASKHGEAQEVLEISLGAFSLAIEDLYCQRVPLGVAMEEMPCGMSFCHFESDFWSLDDNLGWDLRRAAHMFFPRDADVSADLESIAVRLNFLLPKFVAAFGSVEWIVDYKSKGLGMGTTSTESKLKAAAGCVVLGRYEQAEALIKDGIKAGTAPLLRQIADRLHETIQARKST